MRISKAGGDVQLEIPAVLHYLVAQANIVQPILGEQKRWQNA